ncbi:hypothetical protein O77CONTIG1_03246 [Leptolyngbya sp. O-77]|nr:hypothetical protein O77CONTIG1_03246 [Leptolyngbya sp. O-77]
MKSECRLWKGFLQKGAAPRVLAEQMPTAFSALSPLVPLVIESSNPCLISSFSGFGFL